MSIRGRVIVEHRNKNGRLLHFIDKHNTITELGKAASLFFGVSALGIPNDVRAGYVYPTVDGAPPISNGYNYSGKGTDTVVECELLKTPAADIAAASLPSLFIPADADIIGFAKEKTAAGSLAAKEGIRVVPQNSLKQLLAASASGNTASFGFRWTGIEGLLKTVLMKVPNLGLAHLLPSMLDTTYRFIPAGLNGVPNGKIAFGGASYSKLLDLETFAITDFTPVGSYAAPTTHWNSLKFGDYVIESLEGQIRVINSLNGTTYTENWSNLCGCWIEGTKLYAATGSNQSFVVYELTVDDSSITATIVTTADHIATSWTNMYKLYIAGLSDGKVILAYSTGTGTYSNTKTVLLENLLSTTELMKFYEYSRGEYINYNSYCVYLDNYINLTPSRIVPSGQLGWVFSYLDLESNWTINATDTVTVTYTYELEEVV